MARNTAVLSVRPLACRWKSAFGSWFHWRARRFRSVRPDAAHRSERHCHKNSCSHEIRFCTKSLEFRDGTPLFLAQNTFHYWFRPVPSVPCTAYCDDSCPGTACSSLIKRQFLRPEPFTRIQNRLKCAWKFGGRLHPDNAIPPAATRR